MSVSRRCACRRGVKDDGPFDAAKIGERAQGETPRARNVLARMLVPLMVALLTSGCTLARLDRDLIRGDASDLDRASGELYLRMAGRKFDRALRDLRDAAADGRKRGGGSGEVPPAAGDPGALLRRRRHHGQSPGGRGTAVRRAARARGRR